MKVKEVSQLVGISVRTLHHYDEIGLLTPSTSENGYRHYSDQDLERLQQILFFRELDFSLKKIKDIIDSPQFKHEEALKLQRKMLLDKQGRISQMVETIDKTLQHMKGEITMSNKDKFAGFDFNKNPYEKEARERWGDDAVDQSQKKLNNMSETEKQAMGEEMNAIYQELASLRDKSPESKEAQAAIKKWFDYLNGNFGTYSLEAFKGLGQMYVYDERFTKNIDQFGEGLAKFMSEAMAVYADYNKK